jgi:hypothetical protein
MATEYLRHGDNDEDVGFIVRAVYLRYRFSELSTLRIMGDYHTFVSFISQISDFCL